MALAYVPLEIDEGEDWTVQIVIADQDGSAVNLTRPMQMDLRNQAGSVVLSLSPPGVNDPGTDIPEITFSSDIGMIQIHIAASVTASLQPGVYSYDLFASVNDGNAYAGNQRIRVLAGQATVNKRVTVMT